MKRKHEDQELDPNKRCRTLHSNLGFATENGDVERVKSLLLDKGISAFSFEHEIAMCISRYMGKSEDAEQENAKEYRSIQLKIVNILLADSRLDAFSGFDSCLNFNKKYSPKYPFFYAPDKESIFEKAVLKGDMTLVECFIPYLKKILKDAERGPKLYKYLDAFLRCSRLQEKKDSASIILAVVQSIPSQLFPGFTNFMLFNNLNRLPNDVTKGIRDNIFELEVYKYTKTA
jgi:hypothetical protein